MVNGLLDEGLFVSEIATTLSISRATVCYHKRRLGYRMDSRCRARYDWCEVQQYYDAGHTVRQCAAHFGFSTKSWYDAVCRGAITPRPQAMPLGELLVKSPRSRNNVKLRLIGAGIKEPRCERCGIARWHKRSLSLCLHHINGDRHDNRLENLQLLCPNCHSQTPNFGSKNKRPLAA
jgi:5-methylcytosine-specific restriction endonuclease McrA